VLVQLVSMLVRTGSRE